LFQKTRSISHLLDLVKFLLFFKLLFGEGDDVFFTPDNSNSTQQIGNLFENHSMNFDPSLM